MKNKTMYQNKNKVCWKSKTWKILSLKWPCVMVNFITLSNKFIKPASYFEDLWYLTNWTGIFNMLDHEPYNLFIHVGNNLISRKQRHVFFLGTNPLLSALTKNAPDTLLAGICTATSSERLTTRNSDWLLRFLVNKNNLLFYIF